MLYSVLCRSSFRSCYRFCTQWFQQCLPLTECERCRLSFMLKHDGKQIHTSTIQETDLCQITRSTSVTCSGVCQLLYLSQDVLDILDSLAGITMVLSQPLRFLPPPARQHQTPPSHSHEEEADLDNDIDPQWYSRKLG